MVNNERYLARLRSADWLRADATQQLMAMLDGVAGRTRAVGGVVRDTILDMPRGHSDIDLATELTPDEVTERAVRGGASVYPTGIEHGTVTVRHGPLVAEVTTLREDMATDGRRAVVSFGTDWSRDAERRDFTLNALYVNMDGELFDPVGGLGDCVAGRVRFIGDPVRRIEEDRLRVYRFFRFSASHGREQFDAEGLDACAAFAGRLSAVSAERVGGEMRRILGIEKVAATLEAMIATRILELDEPTARRLRIYEQLAERPSAAARLALIVEAWGADALRAAWRLSNDELVSVETVLAAAALVAQSRLGEAAYRYPDAVADGLDVGAVLAGWSPAQRDALQLRLSTLSVPRFPLSGKDLIGLGMRPGPALGSELDRLERAWIEAGFHLDRDELLAMAKPG